MASSTLQEFLVQLGFKVDEAQLGKFTGSLVTVGKSVVGISLALEGAYLALTAFTTKIASELENLFYSSQRAGTTIQNLQALQFALGQTGQGAESAAGILQQFAMSMRMNPAIEGFLHGLGVMTRGVDGHLRDTNDIFEDFIHKMRSEPFPIAAQMAEYLGISPQQLLMLEAGQDARLKAERDYLNKTVEMGIDTNKYGERSKEFMNQVRELGNTFELLWQGIGAHMMTALEGPMRELDAFMIAHAGQIIDAEDQIEAALGREIGYWQELFGWMDKIPGATTALKASLATIAQVLERMALPLSTIVDAWEKLKSLGHVGDDAGKELRQFGQDHPAAAGLAGEVAEGVTSGMKKVFEWLKSQGGFSPTSYSTYAPEQQGAILAALHLGNWRGGGGGGGGTQPASFNIGGTMAAPSDDLLDRVRVVESGGHNNAVSPTGAEGPYQFMPATARRFGLTNPFDPVTARAAASKYLSYLLNMFGGNVAKALAGYNWGEGNVAKDVAKWGDAWLQHAPNETQNYVGKILGGGGQSQRSAPSVHIEQHNNIRSTDPAAAGQEVAVKTRSIWSDVVRVMRQPGVYA